MTSKKTPQKPITQWPKPLFCNANHKAAEAAIDALILEVSSAEHRVYFKNNSRICFFNAAQAQKIRGPQFDCITIDECTHHADPLLLDVCTQDLRAVNTSADKTLCGISGAGWPND